MKEYECQATCQVFKNHKCCNYCNHLKQCDNICSVAFLTDTTCNNTMGGNTVYIVNRKLKNQSP